MSRMMFDSENIAEVNKMRPSRVNYSCRFKIDKFNINIAVIARSEWTKLVVSQPIYSDIPTN
jgi:hypothetical protein